MDTTKNRDRDIFQDKTFFSPTYDTTFKILFATKANKAHTVFLLKYLLGLDSDEDNLSFSQNELSNTYKDSAKSTVDVMCTINGNKSKVNYNGGAASKDSIFSLKSAAIHLKTTCKQCKKW